MLNASVPCTAACASLHHLHFQTANTGLCPVRQRNDTISRPSHNIDAGGNLYGLQRPAVNWPLSRNSKFYLNKQGKNLAQLLQYLHTFFIAKRQLIFIYG